MIKSFAYYVLVGSRLNRIGRLLSHLLTIVDDLKTPGVAFRIEPTATIRQHGQPANCYSISSAC